MNPEGAPTHTLGTHAADSLVNSTLSFFSNCVAHVLFDQQGNFSLWLVKVSRGNLVRIDYNLKFTLIVFSTLFLSGAMFLLVCLFPRSLALLNTFCPTKKNTKLRYKIIYLKPYIRVVNYRCTTAEKQTKNKHLYFHIYSIFIHQKCTMV